MERLFRILSPLVLTAVVAISLHSNGSKPHRNVVKVDDQTEIMQAINSANEAHDINAGTIHTASHAGTVHDEILVEADEMQRRMRR